LNTQQISSGKMLKFGLALVVGVCLWVPLGVASFFLHFLHRGSEKLAIAISSAAWAFAFFYLFIFVKRDGYSVLGMIYYGTFPKNDRFVFVGFFGVLKMCFYVLAFSFLIGAEGAGIFAAPTVLFAKSHGSSDFKVTNISYFRGSITHEYLVDVAGDPFSGQFLARDNEPALSSVYIKDNNLGYGVDCLHINYRYWYFGAVVDSLQSCAKTATVKRG